MRYITRAFRASVALAACAALAAPARAQDAAKPEPEAPKPTEFLAGDLIRRPDGMIVHYYRANYVDPAILVKELEVWKSPKGTVSVAGPQFVGAPVPAAKQGEIAKTNPVANVQNIVRIIETEEQWPVLRRVLDMVDRPQPQVRIEAKVVELTFDDQLRIGMESKITRPVGDTFFQSLDVKYPNPLDAVNSTVAKFSRDEKFLTFDYTLSAVSQGAKAEVTASPSVLASQGETAIIRSGDLEPLVQQNISGSNVITSTQFKDIGIRLEVQPLLVGRDAVRVRVSAEASRLSDFRVTATSSTTQAVNPVISSRNADTVVTVLSGDTIIIGGLEQALERDTKTGIPLLKDIPGLGALFGSTTKRSQKTELYFWITLTIENPADAKMVVPTGELLHRSSTSGTSAPADASAPLPAVK
ncbi:MAG: hypothetical protein HMLKMBBP_00734 [Planctomycetes bacterium]|nr:hypothetical protein [Planctomycetota bacterium]